MDQEIQGWEQEKKIAKLVKALQQPEKAEQAKSALVRLGKDSLHDVLYEMSWSLISYKNFSNHSFDRKERVFQLHCEIVHTLGKPAIEELKALFQQKKSAMSSATLDYQRKGIVAFYLSVLGGEGTIDILIAGLQEESTAEALANLVNDERKQSMIYYRSCVISALTALGDPRAIPAIYQDLVLFYKGSLKTVSRMEDSLSTLNNLKGSLAVLTAISPEPIIELFRKNTDPYLLETTMEIIVDAHIPQTASFFHQVIAEEEYKLKLKAAEGLINLGQKLHDEEIEALIGSYSPKNFPYTIPDIERKKAFFLMVGRTGHPKAVGFLRDVMEKEKLNWEMQAPVYEGLGRAQDKATTDFMLKQLETAGILVTQGIVKALGYTNDLRIFDAFAMLLKNKKNLSFDGEMRFAMEQFEDTPLEDMMLKYLDHAEPCYRELGVIGVGKFRTKQAVPRLIELYPDAGNSGKAKIIEALKFIGTPEAREFADQHKSKCYIATAVYGDFNTTEVLTLRNYRDDVLLQSRWGRSFVRAYYRVSPGLAKYFSGDSLIQKLTRRILDGIVAGILEQDRE